MPTLPQKSDRRTFLKGTAQGALGAGLGLAFPALGRNALARAQGPQNLNPPIPASEAGLRQIKAEPWVKVDDRNLFLKGMAFDRANHLTVMAAYPGEDASKGLAGRVDRSIISISPDKKITTLIKQRGLRFVDHVIHKDGRIFIACLSGELMMANADGSNLQPVTSRANGKPQAPSDLTFDSKGNLYVTDFIGSAEKPTGGVYRWAPDFQSVELFGPNLVTPNGIAFTPDERTVWIACSIAKKLFRFTLDSTGTKVETAESVYDLSAPGGDGIRVDMKGNFYLAINFQGRVIVFDKHGKPIATVLMPGREHDQLTSTTNVEFLPGTNQAYMVASGDVGGTWIYKFEGLAKGAPLYSHQ